MDAVRVLTGLGADITAAANNGVTALYIAAWNGHEAVVAHLVSHGASVDQAKNDGATPVFFAALLGHTETVRTLADLGADLTAAAAFAAQHGETQAAQTLRSFRRSHAQPRSADRSLDSSSDGSRASATRSATAARCSHCGRDDVKLSACSGCKAVR